MLRKNFKIFPYRQKVGDLLGNFLLKIFSRKIHTRIDGIFLDNRDLAGTKPKEGLFHDSELKRTWKIQGLTRICIMHLFINL